MIIVKLMGGLGNQMFQYAFAKSISLLQNQKLIIDRTFLDDRSPKEDFTFRDYNLGFFNIMPDFAGKEDLRLARNETFFQKIFPFYKSYVSLSDCDILNLSSDKINHKYLYLDGYWQKEEYFKPVEAIIRKEFTFKTTVEQKDILDKIINTDSISLHIRRGDYALNETVNTVHGLLSLDYYEKAIDHFKPKVKDPHIFVFSDDISWAKKNLHFERLTFIENLSPANASDDMQLMSHCKHNIIANSTYSWWGAWLNTNPEKTVIAPQKWFADASRPSDKIIPDNWIQL